MTISTKAILIGAGFAGFFVVGSVIDAQLKFNGQVRAAAWAACEGWASEAGTFISRSGPYRFNDDGPGLVRETNPRSYTQGIRFCRRYDHKGLIQGAEFRRDYINDSCQRGFKFKPSYYPGQSKESAIEDMWRASCGGKGNPSKVVKTWEW